MGVYRAGGPNPVQGSGWWWWGNLLEGVLKVEMFASNSGMRGELAGKGRRGW